MATPPQAVPGVRTQVPGPAIRHVRRRRRPSGEPPPLPRHLNASGKWWLALSCAVGVTWLVVIAPGTAVFVDVADTWVLTSISRLRSPTLTQVAEAAAVLT